MSIRILAIESSCDDTSIAILEDTVTLYNRVASQGVHEKYGGIVPELASRAHQVILPRLLKDSLSKTYLTIKDFNAIAFTQGPGLLGSILVGGSFAKGLSLACSIPLVAIDHIQAHVLSTFLTSNQPSFPFICLVASGGHTMLFIVKNHLEMKLIGQTKDDAVGEVFDKVAKELGLGYPGGKKIDEEAQKGNPNQFAFTKATMPKFDFSFSGVKTSIIQCLQKEKSKDPNFISKNLSNFCASLQATLINMLLDKIKLAVEQTGIQQIAVAGGVAANSLLRNKLKQLSTTCGWQIYIPEPIYCTDNAAMVGLTGYYKYLQKDFAKLDVDVLIKNYR